jgi:hypothetical protein
LVDPAYQQPFKYNLAVAREVLKHVTPPDVCGRRRRSALS